MLFVHAGIADSSMWDRQWFDFLPFFSLIRTDLRGFGNAPARTVDGADHHDLRDLIERLGIDRVALVASSFGGNVAVDFALTYPDQISALVLVCTLAGMTEPSPGLREIWRSTDAALAAGEIEHGAELEIRAWVDGPRRAPNEVDARVRGAVRVMNRRIWERSVTEPGPKSSEPPIDRVARLGELSAPTLLITGAFDQPDVAASMNRLARDISHAERLLIANAAHFPNLERPAEFNAAVLDFLRWALSTGEKRDGGPL